MVGLFVDSLTQFIGSIVKIINSHSSIWKCGINIQLVHITLISTLML